MKQLFLAILLMGGLSASAANNSQSDKQSRIVTPHFWGDQKYISVSHNDSVDCLLFKSSTIRQNRSGESFSGSVYSNNMGIRHLRYVRNADESVYVIATFESGRVERWSVSK